MSDGFFGDGVLNRDEALIMKPLEVRVAPENSIIFVSDPTGYEEIPLDSIGTAPVVATPSCIAIGTLAQQSGETTIRLGDSFEHPAGELAFDSTLETPGKIIAVTGARLENFLSMRVRTQVTNVKVWVNDTREPDLIIIQAR